jgi:hypothetical protein
MITREDGRYFFWLKDGAFPEAIGSGGTVVQVFGEICRIERKDVWITKQKRPGVQ